MSKKSFGHEIGDLVLVKWEDGMVYFAKIKAIDWRRRQCVVIFDDKSTDKATFSQIHSVDETTTDIICIKCKKDNSEHPNEIVLCDGCGIGFHQKCHSPSIPASAVELDNPWKCVYCVKGIKNPYLTESIDVLQSLFEEDSASDSTTQSNTVLPGLNNIVVKQECLSDDDATYMEQKPSIPAVQTPSMSGSAISKKKKGKQNDNIRKTTQSGKRRPLQELRRKFARSRLGRNTSIIISQHKKTPNDVGKQPTVNDNTVKKDSVQSTSRPLRKRTATDRNLSSSSNSSNDLSSESSSSSSDESAIDVPLHVNKRPRSLRVSLTLPPSVETTPISNRPTPAATPRLSPPAFTEPMNIVPVTSPITEQVKSKEPSPVDTNDMEYSSVSPVLQIQHEEEQREEQREDFLTSTNGCELEEMQLQQSNYPETSANDSIITSTTSETPSGIDPPTTSPCDNNQVVTDSVSTISDLTMQTNEAESINTSSNNKRSTSTSSLDESLVKVSPGVTQLMPAKRKRPSVISDTPLPPLPKSSVSDMSPLEQLRFEIATSNRLEMKNNRAASSKISSSSSATTVVQQSTGTITSAPPIQSHHSRKSSAPTRAYSRPSSLVSSISTVSSSPVSAITLATSHPNPQTKRPDNLIVISPSPSPPPLPPPLPQARPTTSSTLSGGPATHPQLMAYYVNHKGHPQLQQNPAVGGANVAEDAIPKVGEHHNSNKMLMPPSLKQHQNRGYTTFHHPYKPSIGKAINSSVAVQERPQQQITYRSTPLTTRPPHVSKFSSPSVTAAASVMPPPTGKGVGPSTVQPYAVYQSNNTSPALQAAGTQHVQHPVGSSVVAAIRPSNNVINATNQQTAVVALQQQHLTAAHHHQRPPPQYHTVVAASSDPQQQQQLAILTSPKSGDPATLYAIVTAGSQQAVYDAHGNGYIMSTPAAAPPLVVQQHQRVVSHNVPVGDSIVPVSPVASGGPTSMLYAGVAANTVPIAPNVVPTSTKVLRRPPPTHNQGSHQSKTANIYTTKPCAVVNAIPTQAQVQHEYNTKTVSSAQSRNPKSTPPLPQPSNKKGTPENSVDGQHKDDIMKEKIHEAKTDDISQKKSPLHLLSSTKYKDFDALSANDLMDIFDGALKKFQRNGKIYEAYTSQNNKKIPPPNVQVHPVGESALKTKPSVNNVSPCTSTTTPPVIYTSPSHSKGLPYPQQHQSSSQYTMSIPDQGLQKHRTSSLVRNARSIPHQVHSTGVFIPPTAAVNRSETTPVTPVMYKTPSHQHSGYHTQHRLQPPRGIPLKQPSNIMAATSVSKQHQSMPQPPSQPSSYNSNTHRSTGTMTSISPQSLSQKQVANASTNTVSVNRKEGSAGNNTQQQQQQGAGSAASQQKLPTTEKRRPRKPETPSNIHQIRTMQQQAAAAARTSPVKSLSKGKEKRPSTSTASVVQRLSKRVCDKCGKLATFLCSGCHKIWYCGRDCQVSAWNLHATTCGSK